MDKGEEGGFWAFELNFAQPAGDAPVSPSKGAKKNMHIRFGACLPTGPRADRRACASPRPSSVFLSFFPSPQARKKIAARL